MSPVYTGRESVAVECVTGVWTFPVVHGTIDDLKQFQYADIFCMTFNTY